MVREVVNTSLLGSVIPWLDRIEPKSLEMESV